MSLSVRDGHLRGRVLDLLDDEAGPEDAHLAGLGIDADVDVLVAGRAPVGRLDRLFDGPDQLLPRDALSRRSAAGGRRRNLDSLRASRSLCTGSLGYLATDRGRQRPVDSAAGPATAAQQKTWGSPTSRAAGRLVGSIHGTLWPSKGAALGCGLLGATGRGASPARQPRLRRSARPGRRRGPRT